MIYLFLLYNIRILYLREEIIWQTKKIRLEEGEEEEQAEAKPKKKFSISPMIIKILMIIAALLVVILISGLIAYFVSKGVGKALEFKAEFRTI